MNNAICSKPGMSPAISSFPIGSIVRMPYKTRMTLGGIKVQRVRPAAAQDVDKPSSHLYFFISGKDILAIVAVVAFTEPEMAETIALVPIVVMARPPRI